MPTLDEIRDDAERSLAAVLAKLDAQHRDMLLDAIEKYGRVQDIPEDVWREIIKRTEDELVVMLLPVMILADSWTTKEIQRQQPRLPTQRPPSLAGYAMDAARRASEVAAQTTDTTRTRLGRAIEDSRLAAGGDAGPLGELTRDGIRQAIDDVLNDDRRRTIAANETTGAMTTGQRGAADRVAGSDGATTAGGDGATTADGKNVRLRMLWQTESDNRVCPRCRPLHDSPEEVWGKVFPNGPGQDAHPNCRCWLKPVVELPQEEGAT